MEKPDACTLPTALVPLRVGEFTDLFASSLRSVSRPSPVLLRLALEPGSLAVARDLTARESACCSFFSFTFDGSTLDVGVPAAHVPVLDGLERLAHDAVG